MKKSAIISALFTMMLVLTSFSTPNETGGRGTGMGNGGQFETGGGGTGMGRRHTLYVDFRL